MTEKYGTFSGITFRSSTVPCPAISSEPLNIILASRQKSFAAAAAAEESLLTMQAEAPPADGESGGSAPAGDAWRQVAELREEVDALLEQLVAEADLGSGALDRAESAEAAAAQLQALLEQQASPPFMPWST